VLRSLEFGDFSRQFSFTADVVEVHDFAVGREKKRSAEPAEVELTVWVSRDGFETLASQVKHNAKPIVPPLLDGLNGLESVLRARVTSP
jgi:hypothetical protein